MVKILIVDDEKDIMEFAANFFRRKKIKVITAGSGEEAINLVSTEKPQIVLLDIKMKGMDGIEVLENIKKLHKNIEVIMVTGKNPEEEDAFKRCKELGAVNYVHKPLELDELDEVVMKLVEGA